MLRGSNASLPTKMLRSKVFFSAAKDRSPAYARQWAQALPSSLVVRSRGGRVLRPQHTERHLRQERDLLEKRAAELSEELHQSKQEVVQLRRDKTGVALELQAQLDEQKEAVGGAPNGQSNRALMFVATSPDPFQKLAPSSGRCTGFPSPPLFELML